MDQRDRVREGLTREVLGTVKGNGELGGGVKSSHMVWSECRTEHVLEREGRSEGRKGEKGGREEGR